MGVVFQSFKIMPRAVVSIIRLLANNFRGPQLLFFMQNSHAYVNAAFRAELGEGSVVKTTPTIVYGGLGPEPVSASINL